MSCKLSNTCSEIDPRAYLDFLKMGGTTKPVIIVDVGLVSIFTLIVCEAHRHAKYANTRGSGGMLPQEVLKTTPSEIESEGIFSSLSIFDVPVDAGTENFLKCIICMPVHAK